VGQYYFCHNCLLNHGTLLYNFWVVGFFVENLSGCSHMMHPCYLWPIIVAHFHCLVLYFPWFRGGYSSTILILGSLVCFHCLKLIWTRSTTIYILCCWPVPRGIYTPTSQPMLFILWKVAEFYMHASHAFIRNSLLLVSTIIVCHANKICGGAPADQNYQDINQLFAAKFCCMLDPIYSQSF